MQNDIERLSQRYPQLLFPIRAGMCRTEEYRAAVLAGQIPDVKPDFVRAEEITLSTTETPAGRAEVLVFGRREDFLHAYRALGYRCEPAEIPDSVGAATIYGLINWEKIHVHRDTFLAAGGEDWGEEFSRFTADKKNYLDSIILLSSGEYSNVTAQSVGLEASEWLEKSLTIRKYHELTHFVCRGLYPEDIDALRDEVIADSIGLLAAFGRVDTALVRRFLGTEGGVFREGGRLSHYVPEDEVPAAVTRVNAMIDDYAAHIGAVPAGTEDVFAVLLAIFPPASVSLHEESEESI